MIGAGCVGLFSAACFVECGWTVWCVDMDDQKVDQVQGGAIPVYGPGLDQIVALNKAAKRLTFSTEL